MLAGKYLIDEKMKSAVLKQLPNVHCQTVKQGILMNKAKRLEILTRLRENNPLPPPSLISVRLLNC